MVEITKFNHTILHDKQELDEGYKRLVQFIMQSEATSESSVTFM